MSSLYGTFQISASRKGVLAKAGAEISVLLVIHHPSNITKATFLCIPRSLVFLLPFSIEK
jgi:hypothetical protein